MPKDELTFNDEDRPIVLALVERLVRPAICDLTRDSIIWPRRERKGTSMAQSTIVEHWLQYVVAMVSELGRLTREDAGLPREVCVHMERFANLPADADDKHATVFRPLGQLVPLEVVARSATTDHGVRLHGAELAIVGSPREKTNARLPWVYDGAKGRGSMANVITLTIFGSVLCDGEFRPVFAPVDARPLAPMGSETADAMIDRLSADMLHDFNAVIDRLRAAGETSAASTLHQLPFVVEHQDFGAPLFRQPNPAVADHFVPGTSHALVQTILDAGRPLAAMANARLGMEHLDRSIGHLRYVARRAARPMSQTELLHRLRDLAAVGALDGSPAERLLDAVNGTLLNPNREPGAWARVHLRGEMFLAGGRDRGATAIQMVAVARISPTGEVQLFLLRARRDDYGRVLKAIENRYDRAALMARQSCLRRWRKRAAAVLVLNGGTSAHLRSGIEAAMEVSNWLYIYAALRR